jgi:F-type H+-transporting ATPase subunit epsilon
MADTFKFELVTPERMLVSEDARQVVVPGLEGQFTVLPGHAPVISMLRPGVIEATLGDNSSKTRVFVRGGLAEIGADRLTVLAERAVSVEAMDAARIAQELQTAEGELASASTDAAKLAAAATVESLKGLQR